MRVQNFVEQPILQRIGRIQRRKNMASTGKASRRKEITMQDIAAVADVSVSTVSRYLADNTAVSGEAAVAVAEAVTRLGYVHTPRIKEQNFSQGRVKTGTIVLMVPNMQNPHFNELVDLIGREVQKEGYFMTLCINNNSPETMETHYKMMCSQKIIGCISACVATERSGKWYRKARRQIPMVTIQSDVRDSDTIMTSDEEGTFEMVEYLIRLGHKHIAFIGHSWDIELFSRRLRAYKSALEKYGIPVRNEYISLCQANSSSGYEQACRIISLPKRPTAIHCFNTYTATGVYLAIRNNKLSIPGDISLSSFDDAAIATVLTPTLTVVSQPMEAIAKTAVQLVLERRQNGLDAPPQHVNFPTTMVVRESVGPCAGIAPEAKK